MCAICFALWLWRDAAAVLQVLPNSVCGVRAIRRARPDLLLHKAVHVGSADALAAITSYGALVDGFVAAAERLLDVHAQLLKSGDVPELNLGGGFGIAYTEADKPLGIEDMAGRIMQAVAAKCAALGIAIPKLAFEPGRIISGPAGITLYSVGTIKDVTVSEQGMGATRKYVSVDGGMSDNARPALYQAEYSAMIASRVTSATPALARVVGKHCESGDIVVRHDYLPSDISVNDVLAVAATGAYCFSLSSNYNFLTRPAMVAVKAGKSSLLIRAETENDLLGRDAGIGNGKA